MNPRRLLGLIVGCFSLIGASVASAHPHVWIDSRVTFVFEQGRLVAIEHEWKLDEFFSSFLIESFDRNRDRKFDSAELDELRKGAFDTLKDFDYFTHLLIDGKEVKLGAAEDFRVDIAAKDAMSYQFRMPLETAVDPITVNVAVSVYDETYYVETRLAPKNPVSFKGIGEGVCTFQIRDDATKKIYMGLVPTSLIQLTCRK